MRSTLEDLCAELCMLIFDYLTSIEVLVTFWNLNQRFRLIISNYLQTDYRLTQIDFHRTNFLTYQLFCREILPNLKSTITSIQLGSAIHYGQTECFHQYQLQRLDTLTIRLINSNTINDILQKFLNYNRLQWFDRIDLILDEETIGWNEQLPFCIQNIPVRELNIIGKVPYVFAQRLLSNCYSITHLTIHCKYDHDLLLLLNHLPNLINCIASVDDRGRDISNDLTRLARLPRLNTFKYEGLMPSICLRRIIIEMNEHLEYLSIYTQDYQWPFYSSEVFSFDFFDSLIRLRTFEFYFRLLTSENLTSYMADMNYFLDRNLCANIACVPSKDLGQIFSLPFAFHHAEIFEKNFFQQIQYLHAENEKSWNRIEHLTLHMNIYDSALLKLIDEKFRKLRSIDYHVPNFSLIPQENELHQYDIRLNTIKKLIIHDSVKHGCHVPQPLFLLTSNLVELDIDHFYLMQILSIVSQQTQSRIFSTFDRLERLTVRQFDERLTSHFFPYFSQIKILALIFIPYKMEVYRTQLIFLDELLHSLPKLISLKFEHIRKPHHYPAYVELQENVNEQFAQFFAKNSYYSKWYDDQTQKHQHKYATFIFST